MNMMCANIKSAGRSRQKVALRIGERYHEEQKRMLKNVPPMHFGDRLPASIKVGTNIPYFPPSKYSIPERIAYRVLPTEVILAKILS